MLINRRIPTFSFIQLIFVPYLAVAEELIIPEGESFELSSGSYEYQRILLDKDARLVLSGEIQILSNELIANEGAVVSVERSSQGFAKITLNVTDSVQAETVRVIGRGEDQEKRLGRAPNGRDGRDGFAKIEQRGFAVKPFVQPCTNGQIGAPGSSGLHGEAGADISLKLPYPELPLSIFIDASGGDGGPGQDGGHGGRGGRATEFTRACFGGPGGRGGDGGNGGDAGFVAIAFVTASEVAEPSNEALALDDLVTIEVTADPGLPGEPGRGGFRGASGSSGGNFAKSDGGIAYEGQPGRYGQPGNKIAAAYDSLAEAFDLRIVPITD